MTNEELRGLIAAISQDTEDHLRRGSATSEARSIIHLYQQVLKLAHCVSDNTRDIADLKANVRSKK